MLPEPRRLQKDVLSSPPSLEEWTRIKAVILEKFSEVAATKNKGMIMKSVMAELKGKADGKVISEVVGELCK